MLPVWIPGEYGPMAAGALSEDTTVLLTPVAAGIGHGADHHRFLAAQLGIEVAAARELDLQAREQVAAELGHGRIDVTNAYLG